MGLLLRVIWSKVQLDFLIVVEKIKRLTEWIRKTGKSHISFISL
jgi:hypothetical protein